MWDLPRLWRRGVLHAGIMATVLEKVKEAQKKEGEGEEDSGEEESGEEEI